MTTWGHDLGTTNSGIARWSAETRRAEVVLLPRICRKPGELCSAAEALDAPRMIPSVVEALELDVMATIGRLPLVRAAMFLGDEAEIGRPAMERNAAWPGPAYAPTFKAQLCRDPRRAVSRLGEQLLSARDVARLFLRELFDEVAEVTGERVRDLVLTTPVEAFDRYRAELNSIAKDLGVRRVRFVDEPVAAALGYGVGLDRAKALLIVDIGGGTLHAARLRLTPRSAEGGHAEVLGKRGRPVGGNLVDRWLAEFVAEELGLRWEPAPADETEVLWQRLFLAEARRVKEALHTESEATFTVSEPDELRGARRQRPDRSSMPVGREQLAGLLARRGFYQALESSVTEALAGEEVDEVLMVGGSTLLPGVYPWLEARFGRDRVRAWQPFESVAVGAATYGGGGVSSADFIVHDYALLTHERRTGEERHTVIIPRGTPFPSTTEVWRRQLVPTCALGDPETLFKLVIYEVSGRQDDGVRYGWDASGTLRPSGLEGDVPTVVALNGSAPSLGSLHPPHQPGDTGPRIDLSFAVTEDRWLVATVRDLLTNQTLMDAEPVVRLL